MSTRRLLGYTLFLTTSAFVSPVVAAPCIAADRAAVIEYEFVQRPAGVAGEFRARQNTSLWFLKIRAIDGSWVEAALAEPMSATPAITTLIVSVHGSGGSYDAGPPSFLARDLPGQGYAVLAINTRQTGPRINTDSFLEVRRDIEAAVYTARALCRA